MAKTILPQQSTGGDPRLDQLALKRKTLVPSYYDADLDTDLPISLDTETALIVLGSETKRKAVAYLKSLSSTKATSSDDYNDLLLVFATQQVINSDSIMQDLQTVTGSFNSFRDSLTQVNNDYPDTLSGMSVPVKAMVKSLGRMSQRERRENFHKLFNNISNAEYAKKDGTALQRELRSWIRVFVSYP